MAVQTAASTSSPAPAPGVALFRQAQAQWAATGRPVVTPESGNDESDKKSLSSNSAVVPSTARTSVSVAGDATSPAASLCDAASAASAVASAPVPTPEGTKKKVGLPHGGFLCLTAEPPAAIGASVAVCEGLQAEIDEARKRFDELAKSYEQHLEHDAADKVAAAREKRKLQAKIAAAEKAAEDLVAEFVPLAREGGYCSAANVRGLARRWVGSQMVPDSSYAAW